MTASEMATTFLAEINQSHNFQVRSSEIANWLTLGQNALFNDLYFQRDKTNDPNKPPPYSYQSDANLNDALQPFQRTAFVNTNTIGVTPNPIDASGRASAHITSVAIRKDSDCSPLATISHGTVYVPASFLSDNEWAAQEWSVYAPPNWQEGKRRLMWYKPSYRMTNSGIQVLPAIRVYPSRITYLVFPLPVKVANSATSAFAWEFNLYNGNPQFVLQPADQDSEFPTFLHQEIVRRGVSIFALANPDYAQFAQENTQLKSGE